MLPCFAALDPVFGKLETFSVLELFGVFFALLMFLRWFIEYCLIQPFMRRYVSGSLVQKISSEWTKLIYYIFTSIWAWDILSRQERPWVRDPELAFTNFPHEFAFEFRLFYMFQFAFYWHLLTFFLFVEQRKRGYWDLLIHHIITLFLVGMSLFLGLFKVGVVVMCLHDITDIPATLAKCFGYLNWLPIAATSLIVGLILWFGMRLVYFPYLIYHGCFQGGWKHLVTKGHISKPVYASFLVFLAVLVVLHVYWFLACCKIIYDSLAAGKVKDNYVTESPQVRADGMVVDEDETLKKAE